MKLVFTVAINNCVFWTCSLSGGGESHVSFELLNCAESSMSTWMWDVWKACVNWLIVHTCIHSTFIAIFLHFSKGITHIQRRTYTPRHKTSVAKVITNAKIWSKGPSTSPNNRSKVQFVPWNTNGGFAKFKQVSTQVMIDQTQTLEGEPLT